VPLTSFHFSPFSIRQAWHQHPPHAPLEPKRISTWGHNSAFNSLVVTFITKSRRFILVDELDDGTERNGGLPSVAGSLKIKLCPNISIAHVLFWRAMKPA
jgi:hypothetical protein